MSALLRLENFYRQRIIDLAVDSHRNLVWCTSVKDGSIKAVDDASSFSVACIVDVTACAIDEQNFGGGSEFRVETGTDKGQDVATELVQLSVGGDRVNHEININLGSIWVDRDEALKVEELNVPNTSCWQLGQRACDLRFGGHHIGDVTVGVVDADDDVLCWEE